MLRWTLFGFVLVMGACSLLTWRHAPSLLLWKLAILTGEFGHWGALAAATALGITITRWNQFGMLAIPTALLAATATGLLMRPALLAWWLGKRLPAELVRRLGPNSRTGTANLFSWGRLWGLVRQPADRSLATISTHIVGRSPRGESLMLDFYSHASAASAPCVVVIHGGGWDGGDRTQLPALNHRLAALGYAVAAVSYGLAPAHVWPSQRDDIATALSWLKHNAHALRIDPNRLVLLGRSAGGQLATATASHLRDPSIRGVVAYYAPHDLEFAWQFSREDDLLNAVKLLRNYTGGTPATAPENYQTASAYHTVDTAQPPTLLVHGRQDSLVWHRQSERLAGRLHELSVPCVFVSLPWATHACDFSLTGPSGQLATAALECFLATVTAPNR